MNKRKLFVEKAGCGRLYSPAIIEGYLNGTEIVVTAPAEFLECEVSKVIRAKFREVSEEAGPPRMLSSVELDKMGFLSFSELLDMLIEKYALEEKQKP